MKIVDDTINLKDFLLAELEDFIEVSMHRPGMNIGDYTVFKSKDDTQKRKIGNIFRLHENLIFEVVNDDTINIPKEKWNWLNTLESVISKFEEQSGKSVTIHKTEGFVY